MGTSRSCGVLAGALAVLAAAGCGSSAVAPRPPAAAALPASGPVVVTVAARALQLDPALLATPAERSLGFALCTPLLTYPDAAGEQGATLIPGLALDLPAVNRSFTTFTFHLRKGLTFADGRPVTPADVKTAFLRLLSPQLHAPAAVLFRDVLGAKPYLAGHAKDLPGISTTSRAISFRLLGSDPSFPARVALPQTCPVEQGTPPTPLAPAALARQATGPYTVRDYRPGSSLTLVRNPGYPTLVLGPRGLARRIDVRLGVSPRRSLALVRSGGADLALDGVPASLLNDAGTPSPLSEGIVSEPTGAFGYLAVTPAIPPFETPNARRAVSLAVGRLAAARAASIATDASADLLGPAIPGAQSGSEFPLTAQPARARRLLIGVGAALPIRTRLATPASLVPVARRLSAQLRRAGIDARVTPLRPGQRPPADAALVLGTYTPGYLDPIDVLRAVYADGTPAERGPVPLRLDDPQLDRSLVTAMHQSGDSRVSALGGLAVRLLNADPRVAVLWDANFSVVRSSRVSRMVLQPIYPVDLPALGVSPR